MDSQAHPPNPTLPDPAEVAARLDSVLVPLLVRTAVEKFATVAAG